MVMVGFLVVAAYCDVTTGRIPNRLVLCMSAVGLCLDAWCRVRVFDVVLGIAIPFAVLFAFCLFRAIGAGDVKLLSACGIFVGKEVVTLLWGAFVLSAIVGLGMLCVHGNGRQRLRRGWQYLRECLGGVLCRPREGAGRRLPGMKEERVQTKEMLTIPFAGCVLAAACVMLVQLTVGGEWTW
jgi:Flp pilus assembly protein protease CpaA